MGVGLGWAADDLYIEPTLRDQHTAPKKWESFILSCLSMAGARCSWPVSSGGAGAVALHQTLTGGSAECGTAATSSAECGPCSPCCNRPGEIESHRSVVSFNELNCGRVSLFISVPDLNSRKQGIHTLCFHMCYIPGILGLGASNCNHWTYTLCTPLHTFHPFLIHITYWSSTMTSINGFDYEIIIPHIPPPS